MMPAPEVMLDRYRRLVIVVRADPVICGHSVEARNIAEAAMQRGFTDVRILSWPLDRLEAAGLPLKPLEGVLPYSEGITVERPEPVGDYRVVDGRWYAGLVGRLVELFTDGVPTICLSLYLSPHTTAVTDALTVAQRVGMPLDVLTITEAVGSDITNVVRTCVENDRYGAAVHLLSSYLANDCVLAVSQYTKDLIVTEAAHLDERHGTSFAQECRQRIQISYPALDTASYRSILQSDADQVMHRRGLSGDRYVLFLSRLVKAKGIADLIAGYERSGVSDQARLIIAGQGPQEAAVRAMAAASPLAHRISVVTDIDDDEKPALMRGCTAFVLPTLPRPEFIETFGIALVENMLAGGGPVITTTTGGVPEAVGDTALTVPVNDPDAIASALQRVFAMSQPEWAAHSARAVDYALQFDRTVVLDLMLSHLAHSLEGIGC